MKKLEAKREAKKKQREAEASQLAQEREGQREAARDGKGRRKSIVDETGEPLESFSVGINMVNRRDLDSGDESEEDFSSSNRGGTKSKGGPSGDGSSTVVRGKLLQTIADQKTEIAQIKEENRTLQSELWNLKDSFDKEISGKKKMGRMEETTSSAFQEALEQSTVKLESTTAELQRLKKKLSDTFAPSTLARILPTAEQEAKMKKEKKAREKKAKSGKQEEEESSTFSLFGGGPKQGMRNSKGVDELLNTIQEQTKENKDLRREVEGLQKELTRWEEKQNQEEAEKNGDAPWYKSFGGGGVKNETKSKEELHRELSALEVVLADTKDELKAALEAMERKGTTSVVAVEEEGGEGEEESAGWFGSLLGGGREATGEELDPEIEAITTASPAAASGRGDGNLEDLYLENLRPLTLTLTLPLIVGTLLGDLKEGCSLDRAASHTNGGAHKATRGQI